MPGIHFFPRDPWHQQIHFWHVKIFEKLGWYRSWHARPHAEKFHWATLAIYLVAICLILSSVPTADARVIDFRIRADGVEYGKSVRGNPLIAYIFGHGSETIWFVGGIHGHEKSSVYVAVDLVNYLADNPGEVPPERRVIVVPTANPDGFLRSRRANARNIDLNRNFGSSDWKRSARGPGGQRVSGGRSAFSERESRGLKDFMEQEGVTMLIALHARGNYVNPENSPVSRALATKIGTSGGYRYLENWYFYPTTGTLTLWAQERFRASSVTLELPTYTSPDWVKNKPAFLDVIEH